jgi:hypothetical protein
MKRITRRPLAVLFLVLAPLGGCNNVPTVDATPSEEVFTPVDMADGDDQIATSGPDLLEPMSFGTVTYDGSGEMVHPDAVVLPHGWKGRHYWFTATPYPLGNAHYENPSIFNGDAADDWQLPLGSKNPLADPEPGSYLSDPDLSVDPVRGELRLYYRQTLADADQVYLITTRDGALWSVPRKVLNEARYSLISPALVRGADGSWQMWTVNAHVNGCRSAASEISLELRQSPDGRKWGAPTPVKLAVPGRVPWHWDVQYIAAKHEYWALVVAYRNGGSCSESSLYFARSPDGTNWTVSPTPLLGPGVLPKLNDLIYRSTFRYFSKNDMVDVWFSGARLDEAGYHYALATARYPASELLARVERSALPPTADRATTEARSSTLRAAREAFANNFP